MYLNRRPRAILTILLFALPLGSFLGCGGKKDGGLGTEVQLGLPPLPMPDSTGALPKPGPTQDGVVAAQRMVAAYSAAMSMQIDSESDTEIDLGIAADKYHQSSTLRFQRQPDALLIRSVDPTQGTVQVSSDGQTLVQYMGLNNRFQRLTVSGTLPTQTKAVMKRTLQLASPVAMLTGEKMPASMTGFKMVKEERILGKPAYVVSARFDDKMVKIITDGMPFAKGLSPSMNQVKLWIHTEDYTLLQAEFRVGWSGERKNDEGKVTSKNPVLYAKERHVAYAINPKFPADSFRFIAPSGAKEQFTERLGE